MMAAQTVPVAQPPLLICRVVITMHDKSRGEHVGLYPHSMDALDRAMDLFPDARVISVCAVRPKGAMQ
jgi:hypothetical protein